MCGREAIGGKTHPRCLRPWSIDGLLTPLLFTSTVQRLIHQFKYRLVSDLANQIADLVCNYFKQRQQIAFFQNNNFAVVPVPLHPKRLRWRGFNQSQVLGSQLADRWGLNNHPELLERVKHTTPQVELSVSQRAKNMIGAFAVSSPKRQLVGSNLLLVDDLFTTGATVRECAKVLKKSGARSVWALTIARTGRP